MGTAPARDEFAAGVALGLSGSGQKTLPCRYLYDAVGTALFSAIAALPEYGLARADARLISRHAHELPRARTIIELGSGDGSKTRAILEALRPALYVPVDVSAAALDACGRALADVAEIAPVQDAFLPGLRRAPRNGPRLVLFLGSTIGNFRRAEARQFLAETAAELAPGDALLLGTDLVKDECLMLDAYDDPAGVTAAFNLNLLARINRELGANFDLRGFAHEARYNRRGRRIEMHLRARKPQRVRIAACWLEVDFRRGETIWTESSHKYEPEEGAAMGAQAGFTCARQWVDPEWPFAETLLVR